MQGLPENEITLAVAISDQRDEQQLQM